MRPKPKRDQNDEQETETQITRRLNIFRPETNFSMSDMYQDYDMGSSKSSSDLNVGLAAFYSLPKLEKTEIDQIIQELRTDMDH